MAPDKSFNPLDHIGAFKRQSPEAPYFARKLWIRNAIERGASDAELEQWKADIVSAQFQFEVTVGGVAENNESCDPTRQSI